MARILSQNEKTQNTLTELFVPSFAASFLFFLVGGILLLVYAFSRILNLFGNDYLASADNLSQNIHVFDKGLSSSFNSALGGRLGQIMVWSLVGALVYILFWFVKNMFNSVENNFLIDRYSHPDSYNRKKFLGVAFGELFFFVALLIVLAAYSYICLGIIMPAAASMLSSAASHFSFPYSILYIALSVVVPAVAIYVWSIITRITLRLWQLL